MLGAGRLRRVGETERRRITLSVDGHQVAALEGDTLLTAILTNAATLRFSEFDGAPRAGFCLMGACQDCVVLLGDGGVRARACVTPAQDGTVVTRERWLLPHD